MQSYIIKFILHNHLYSLPVPSSQLQKPQKPESDQLALIDLIMGQESYTDKLLLVKPTLYKQAATKPTLYKQYYKTLS